ncbi:MAG: SurA N-terminal domain-containing protein [Elusimicrobiota bacterium]|nr:SurA N-terminal domain-containing protein [Elusimicrobiota bacterium]
MEFVRKHAKTILSIIAAVFIVGLFYMNYQAQGPTAVKVNKSKISYDEYQTSFSRRLDRERDEKDDPLSAEDTNRIKQNVLAQMVQDELIKQHARKFGVKVPDDIIASSIMSMKAFQQDGQFNENIYQRVLTMYYKMSRYEFEENLRDSIKKQFLRDLTLAAAKVSPMELALTFKTSFPKENFEEKRSEFKNTMINEKRSLIYYGWMNDMIKNSEITNNLPKLESRS